MELLSLHQLPVLLEPDPNPKPQSPSLANLVASLEHATLIANQLPSANDQSQILQAYSSIRNAHQQLGDFLCKLQALGSSVSTDQDQKMLEQEDPEIEQVQEGIKDCVLQSKRRKRPLSPSLMERKVEDGVRSFCFNQREHLRSLDLVYQFHG